MLLSAGSAALLARAAGLNSDAVVLAVVLSLSLGRTGRGTDGRTRLLGVFLLPLISLGAAEVGRLMVEHPNAAEPLFVLALSGAIWVRRFGARVAKLGGLVALPFLALLVTPVPVAPGRHTIWWSPVIALIAFFWTAVLQLTAQRLGIIPKPVAHSIPAPRRSAAAPTAPAPTSVSSATPARSAAVAAAEPAAPNAPAPTSPVPRRRFSTARLAPSTRMALQMAVSLGAAFIIGRTLFPTHWMWLVLTAFIVNSGNRGRGDVVYKAVLRVLGASVGTVAAELLSGVFPPRDNTAVVIIFAVLTVAGWLRTLSYAYWAGCVTAVLSLLYGYYDLSGVNLLPERLGQIVLGGLLGVAVAWLLGPVKTADVARRRIADALAPLTDLAAGAARGRLAEAAVAAASFELALARLEEIARPIRVQRLVRQLPGFAAYAGKPQLADAIDAVHRCAEPVASAAQLLAACGGPLDPDTARLFGALAANTGEARRALGRRPGDGRRELPADSTAGLAADSPEARLHAAIHAIDDELAVIAHVFRAFEADATAKTPEFKPPAPEMAKAEVSESAAS